MMTMSTPMKPKLRPSPSSLYVNRLLSEVCQTQMPPLYQSVRLSHDLGIDSLDKVELIMRFESEFQVFLPEKTWEDVETVGQLQTLLQRYLPA